jgi:hypothetical protein
MYLENPKCLIIWIEGVDQKGNVGAALEHLQEYF